MGSQHVNEQSVNAGGHAPPVYQPQMAPARASKAVLCELCCSREPVQAFALSRHPAAVRRDGAFRGAATTDGMTAGVATGVEDRAGAAVGDTHVNFRP